MPDAPELVKDKRVELIIQQLEELPTLPAIAVKVLAVTADEASNADEVVKLISTDQSLSTRILQLVHRADLGVRGDVTTVERAVLLLGFDAVRSAVLAVTIFKTFDAAAPTPASSQFSRDEFWKHSLAVACCAELLADVLAQTPSPHPLDPAEAFTCGLLHDLGKVALDAMLPKSFSRVVEAADLLRGNIADIERSVIGLDHMVVGKRLAERWQLPTAIRDCAWLHGQLPTALPATVPNPRLVNLITLADLIAREQHLGFSGNYTFPVPQSALLDALGLEPAALDPILKNLVNHIEPRAQALGLGQTSTQDLYHDALAQAHKELGKVSSLLAAKNRRLSVRSKFFDALAAFHADLRPDAPAQTVTQAIGQTAATVLTTPSLAAFSLPPSQNFAEVLHFDAQGNLTDTAFVDCSARPTKPAGDGPVRPAGDELEWLLAATSPRLADDHRFWIPLEADGVVVGGVVWGASTGEIDRLATQTQELVAIAGGWSLALRTAQIREEARTLAEQLAEANRNLQTAQTEVLRSRTLSTVGEMAAGAAHEMNNPLMVISGRSQLLAQQLADPKLKLDPKLAQAARQVFEQSHRLSEIISEMMAFAKPVPAKPVESDVADLMIKALTEAKRRTDPADRKIEMVTGDVPPVRVDPEQTIAAITEVIDNALQATDPRKGHVSLHAAYDPYSSRVVITIADDGHGMDEKTAKRAFDPFFSQKPAGRRRGMGLAKALRWIESSGGNIRLDSRPNAGTRALVLLPAAPNAAAKSAAAAASAKRTATSALG